MTKLLKK